MRFRVRTFSFKSTYTKEINARRGNRNIHMDTNHSASVNKIRFWSLTRILLSSLPFSFSRFKISKLIPSRNLSYFLCLFPISFSAYLFFTVYLFLFLSLFVPLSVSLYLSLFVPLSVPLSFYISAPLSPTFLLEHIRSCVYVYVMYDCEWFSSPFLPSGSLSSIVGYSRVSFTLSAPLSIPNSETASTTQIHTYECIPVCRATTRVRDTSRPPNSISSSLHSAFFLYIFLFILSFCLPLSV